MYLDYDENTWIIDIEGDSLTPSVIWVMCYENAITEEKGHFTSYEEIRKFFKERPRAKFVGHNILKFDAPELNRLVGTRLSLSRLVDTLVLATLYNPALAGGHSLDEWGRRLGKLKGQFSDWSKLSEEMIKYCYQDVAVTKELFIRLVQVLTKLGFSEKSCEIQHKITHILKKQRENGFAFNEAEATKLYAHIRQRERELQEAIYHRFPPELKCVKTFARAYKADGTPTKQFERHSREYPSITVNDDGSYGAFQWVSFNLGSPKQRVEKLLELGWVPEEFTPRTKKGGGGNPKVTTKGKLSPSLERFVEENDVEEARLLAKWISLNALGNNINTWLNAYNPETGCIHGYIEVAQTLRFRHNNPNTANIPAVKVNKETKEPIRGEEGTYSYEARNCWTTRDRDNRTLVGTDASGLELRMLAHYLKNDEFTEQVIHGDPHIFNAGLISEVVECDKPKAKTTLYAMMYGAQDPKLGSIFNGTGKLGKQVRGTLEKRLIGLENLVKLVKSEFKAGRIELVDGSKIICPAAHAALNYKLQGGGARVMAQGAIFLERYIREKGLDSLKVGDIHDEWQYDVANGDAHEHARLAVLALENAGEELNLNVPITGESKLGLTWAETH